MNILFVTQSLGKGGAERLTLDLARALLQYPDVKVKIASLSHQNDYAHLSKEIDIEVCNSYVHLSITGKNNINVAHFNRIVDEFQPDVIHSHTYKAELVAHERILKNVLYVTHVHDDFKEFEPFSNRTLFNKKLLTNYFERLRIFSKYRTANHLFITISQRIDNKLKQQLSKYWHKTIYFVPNGIQFKTFDYSTIKETKEDEVNLISVGRFFGVKNHKYLIKVVDYLKTNYTTIQWKLKLLGDGELRNELEKMTINLDLSKEIEFTGIVEDVESYLKKSDIYIHSAVKEPFGLVMVEAMASSLPVVSLNGGGNEDFVINGENGFILPQETQIEVFAKHIVELVENRKLYTAIATNAYQTAKEHDISESTSKLYELYKRYIKAKTSTNSP